MNLPIKVSAQPECSLNQQNNQSKNQVDYSVAFFYYQNKQERTKRKDQPWRRLATVNKIAQKSGYNLPTYREKRTIAELLKLYGEYAYLTGKKLGNYYLSTLDIDIRKAEFPKKLIERLEKNTVCLLDYLRVSHDQTKKGLHIDILTPEPLNNNLIYWTDKLDKKWTIGSIQSLGKYVVGKDPDKHFIKNGKWYWKTKSNEEVKTTLNQFFFYLNNQEKEKLPKNIQLLTNETLKTIRYQAWDYSLNKSIIREYSLTTEEPLKIPQKPLNQPKKYFTIQAKILSKHKTNLENIWKIFYLNQQGNQNYFLLNCYHRKKTDLDLGTTRNILLLKGRKHAFFYRFI